MRAYLREGVRHVWLLDPRSSMVEVRRLDGGRWREVDSWEGDPRLRAEPFDDVEIDLGRLWAR